MSYDLFDSHDIGIIERFESDILEVKDPPEKSIQQASSYSQDGELLRRSVLSYVAAGDLADESFLEFVGKVPNEFKYESDEIRIIDGVETSVRKYPIARSPLSAFTNRDVRSDFYSAYIKNSGELRLWFMGQSNGFELLQCYFSNDDGHSWFDLWEFIENNYRRVRIDSDKKTQFIDRDAYNSIPRSLEGVDPLESDQEYLYGINVHWSRLKKHKIDSGEGELTIDSETQLEIASPYVFYQSATNLVFLFYVYENCLLCKVFNDGILTTVINEAESDDTGISSVKKVIEREVRSYFIDGSLAGNSGLHEEMHGFYNEDTNEVMASGNIIFRYPFSVNEFKSDRAVSAQRICAYTTPKGHVRVFYKHADSINLKSAVWIGHEWWAEDFLRDSSKLEPFEMPEHPRASFVLGGFGGTGFDGTVASIS